MQKTTTRRQLLRAGMAGGAALTLPHLTGRELIGRALAAAPSCGALAGIEHVVFFVQENRSFDHYFGRYRAVRGFGDPAAIKLHDGSGLSVFAQPGYPPPGFDGHLFPFHIDSRNNGDCTNDLTHDWGPQHRSYDGGSMDGFVAEHVAELGPAQGAITMGYYERSDLPFYYALADAFTLCDGYHCSVLGPSDPNHVMMVSGTIDPDGRGGGPVTETYAPQSRNTVTGMLDWTTMPEQLEAAGVSWKVYSADNSSPEEDPAFPLFRKYHTNPVLNAKGLAPVYPTDFAHDVANGQLPAVSWVYTSIAASEHPPAPITYGEATSAGLLSTLVSNPGVWAKTALFITWDENGGFFDHVGPITAPNGTPGEYLTVANPPAAAEGIRGPIGLGFRVPLLVVSPFSAGGLVCSDVFDHTSLMRFLESRFGAEVPNLSAWRRSVTGDLTSAFNFAAPAQDGVPPLPQPSVGDPRVVASDCAVVLASKGPGAGAALPAYPVPPNAMPAQESGPAKRPSGLGPAAAPCAPGKAGSRLRVAIHHVPHRAGRRAFRALVEVVHSQPLSAVQVRLNGRLVRASRRGRFTVVIRPKQLRRGVNRIGVLAVDDSGARATAVVHLRGSRSRRHPRRHVHARAEHPDSAH